MYLDPGLGSLVIQILIGVVVSVPTLIVVFRHRLVSLYRRFKKKDSEKTS